VTHLRKIYTALDAKLRREGRLAWVAEEMGALADPATYLQDPETAWERLRPRTTNRRFLGVLQAVAAWREREAQRINIPRQRLVKDETLLEVAATTPENPADLARARGISEGFAKGRSGLGLIAAVKAGKEAPDDTLPEAPKDRAGPPASPALVALLKVLLAAKSEEHNVAPKLLASSDDLDRLAAGDSADVPALHGWRRDVFGDAALALKGGRLALGVDGKRVKLIPAG
jgi:ribonuclease D